MRKRKLLTTFFIMLMITLSGILVAKGEIVLKYWEGDDDLAEVEETTQRLIDIINTLDDDINFSNKNLSKARAEVITLQATLDQRTIELNQKIEDYKTLESEQSQLQETYDNLVSEKNQLQTTYESLLTDYNNEVDAHNTTKSLLAQLETQINDLEDDIEDLKDDKSILRQEKAALELQIQTLNTSLEEKQTTIDSQLQNISTLETTITTLEGEKATLVTKLSEAEGHIDFLNGEVEKANKAATDHKSAVCDQLEQLPPTYRLTFREQCASISVYDIETNIGVGTPLEETYSEFRLTDFSTSSNTSLYLGTNVDKNKNHIEADYKEWQNENTVSFTYESSTGFMTLNINGETVNQLEYTEASTISLLDTIQFTLTETSNAGFETGELIISDITLNNETKTQTYNVKDDSLSIKYFGHLTDTNNDINLSFKLSVIGTMPESEDTLVDVVIGRS